MEISKSENQKRKRNITIIYNPFLSCFVLYLNCLTAKGSSTNIFEGKTKVYKSTFSFPSYIKHYIPVLTG